MPERILFITGRLAEASLRKTLDRIESKGFTYEIHQIGVSVAALATTEMIKRRLREVNGFDQIMLPGLCAGDVESLSQHFGTEVVRGTVDLKDLPEYFGSPEQAVSLDDYSVQIFAEIVDAPQRSIEQIVKVAEDYRNCGADVIDLGCLPGQEFPHLEESVQTLASAGFKTSVDSLEDDDLLRGGRAGADYLLSLSEHSLWIADEVASVPVLIPYGDRGQNSLYRAIDAMQAKNMPFLADAILNPIHFGFTESIANYLELRSRYPEVEIMIGTGNITELTHADTTGINAIMLGIASELRASAILTTQVSKHARSVVQESDIARRIMHAAMTDSSLPTNYSDGLMALHDKKPHPSSVEEIRDLASMIKDPSFRIQVSDDGIHIFNRDGLHESTDPYELFSHLNVESDGSHAFYLGVELAKAQIAWQLGKRYVQDHQLKWGCIFEEKQAVDWYKKPGATLQSSKKDRK